MVRFVIVMLLHAVTLWGCTPSGQTESSAVTDTSKTTTQTVTATAPSTDTASDGGTTTTEPTAENFLITFPTEFVNKAAPLATWNKAPKDVDYDIIVAPDSMCKVPLQAFGDVTTESQQLKLLPEGTYYICVYAIQEKGKLLEAKNSPYKFVVDLTPPTPPTLTELTANSFTNNNTPAINWTAATGHDFYDLMIASDAGCTSAVQTYANLEGTVTMKSVMSALDDGAYFMCLTARDKAGNTTAAANDGLAFTVDTVAPVPLALTTSTADGTYKAGTVMTFTMTFSEIVEVVTTGGTPSFTLEMGTTDRDATYVSGSGTDTLTFTYTIQAGDTSADLDAVAGSGQIKLNGGTIQDRALNDAVRNLPIGATSGSLASNKAIVIDTTAPTVTGVTSATANGIYKAPSVINVTVAFSEPVVVTNGAAMAVLLETGTTDRSALYQSGSGTNFLLFSYTVQSGDLSADLNVHANNIIVLNGATLRDPVGNDAVLSIPTTPATATLAGTKAIVVDAVAPTVASVTSTTANGAYNAGDVIAIRVNFSESVTVVGGAGMNITLETGATDALPPYSSGSGTSALIFTYTVASGENSADLNTNAAAGIVLGGATVRDAAGNDAVLTIPTSPAGVTLAGAKAIVIDTITPTISAISATSPNATYKIGDTVTLTLSFSENVNVVNGSNVKLNLDTGAQAVYSTGSGTSTLSFDYTVANGHQSADLDASSVSLVPSGVIRDPAQNNANVTLPGTTLAMAKDIVIDGIPPGAFNITGPAASTYTASQTATWDASTDATTYDITVSTTNNCASPTHAPGSPHNGVAATSLGLALADGKYYLCATAKDAAGNSVSASNQPWAFEVESSVLHVSYTRENGGNYALYHGGWASGAATLTSVDTGAGLAISARSSLTLDSNDKVHVSYGKENGGFYDWRYATNASGAFAAETVAAGTNNDSVGLASSLALASNDNVRLAARYHFDDGVSPVEDRVAYVTGTAGAFGAPSTIQAVTSASANSQDQSLALDNSNVAHLLHAYYDGANYVLRYRNNNGGWGAGANDVLSAPACTQYLYGSIALSSADKVHGAYLCVTNTNACSVYHVTNASGSWVHTAIGDVYASGCSAASVNARHRPTLALDSNDKVHLVYYDEMNGKLVYAENTGGSFVSADLTWGVGWQPTIVRDGANKLYVLYLTAGAGSGNLKMLHNNAGAWASVDIDMSGLVIGIGDGAVDGVAGRSNR